MNLPLHREVIPRVAAAEPAAERAAGLRAEGRFALAVVGAFLLVTVPVMLRHEMWRDETQAWLLVRDVGSLGALFHELRYEGHPALWYLLLGPLARAGLGAGAMQWLSLTCGALSVYVVARLAPFSRVARTLFAFGYFVAYGYTIVARSYSLEMLLWIVLIAMIAERRARWLAGVLALLVANTTAYGAILVLALVGAVVVDAVISGRHAHTVGRRLRRASAFIGWSALGLVLFGAQVRRPADAPFNGNGPAAPRASDTLVQRPVPLREQLTVVWGAYVPISNPFDPDVVWQGNAAADRSPRTEQLAIVASVVMFAIAMAVVRRSVLALAFLVIATLGLLLFSLLLFRGVLYHQGHFYLALVGALWLALRTRHAPRPRIPFVDAHPMLLIDLLFALQMVGGVERLGADYVLPFSDSAGLARYLRTHGLRDARIVTYPGMRGSAVAFYLDRPLYELDVGTSATYEHFGAPRRWFDDAQVLGELARCCLTGADTVVLLINRPLTARAPDIAVELLRPPAASMVKSEAFYTYLVYDMRGRRPRDSGAVQPAPQAR